MIAYIIFIVIAIAIIIVALIPVKEDDN